MPLPSRARPESIPIATFPAGPSFSQKTESPEAMPKPSSGRQRRRVGRCHATLHQVSEPLLDDVDPVRETGNAFLVLLDVAAVTPDDDNEDDPRAKEERQADDERYKPEKLVQASLPLP